MCRKVSLCDTYDSVGGGILLEASLLAAAAGFLFLFIDGHMADLACCPVGSRKDMFIQDNAAADAGSKGNHDNILVAFSAALPHFAEGRNVGIVSGFYLKSGKASQLLLHVEEAPAQVCALENIAGFVHRSGNTHADAFHIVS